MAITFEQGAVRETLAVDRDAKPRRKNIILKAVLLAVGAVAAGFATTNAVVNKVEGPYGQAEEYLKHHPGVTIVRGSGR